MEKGGEGIRYLFKKSLTLALHHQNKIGITHTSDGIRITEENKCDPVIQKQIYEDWKKNSGQYDPKNDVIPEWEMDALHPRTVNDMKFEQYLLREYGMTRKEEIEKTFWGNVDALSRILTPVDILLPGSSLAKKAIKEGGEEAAEAAGKKLAQMAGKEALQEAVEKGTKELAQVTTEKAMKEAAVMATEKSVKELAEEAREKLARVAKEVVEETVEEVTDGIGNNATKAMTKVNNIINTANQNLKLGERAPISSLNKKQRELLQQLNEPGSTIIIRKKSVSMNDLRQLTNVTGDEFNMFTKGGKRLIIRGEGSQIRVSKEMLDDLVKGVYGKFSGHTHPAGHSLEPGPADEPFLKMLGQLRSSIWGNAGEGWLPFGDAAWSTPQVREHIRREKIARFYENL